ncbi:MAG: peptide chain release factor N(5)-glutamine methyltransferase [Legionellaceae bacterium]|nr:peptide chain release factor N(5)-glutamine methyltransferase [Legionellaceae bacterium]
MNIHTLLQSATQLLQDYSSSPRLDAEILLAHVLQKPRSFLYAHAEQTLSDIALSTFQKLLSARKSGQPVAYLIQSQEFWSLNLQVSPATLIPRPETELMVELALEYFKNMKNIHLLELGTGSGAIALAIAKEKPGWTITAVDISKEALQIARTNALTLNISNVQFIQSNWFELVPKSTRFDLILSNPPYLAADDPHLPQLIHEPLQALVSGPSGLESLHTIIQQSKHWLSTSGRLILEHGYTQGDAVQNFFKQYDYKAIQTFCDLQKHPRITTGTPEIKI